VRAEAHGNDTTILDLTFQRSALNPCDGRMRKRSPSGLRDVLQAQVW